VSSDIGTESEALHGIPRQSTIAIPMIKCGLSIKTVSFRFPVGTNMRESTASGLTV
jgi:hypothetical protein